MKKSVLLVTILSILLNIGLIYFFIFKGDTVKIKDARLEIILNKANKNFALAEMRGFLESIKGIQEGILNNDTSIIIASGKKSGGLVIKHAPKGMMKSLPMGFKKLGFATHNLFDKIAEDALENFEMKHTQKQLNILLGNCITCHSMYKIGIEEFF